MSKLTHDPLLVAAKAITYVMMGIIAFAGIIVAVCAPALIIFGAEFAGAAEIADLAMSTRLLIALLLAGVAAVLFLAFRFLQHMLRIITSVGEGDPFTPANASRLTAMAWLGLAIQVASVPLAGLGLYVADLAGEDPGTVDFGLDFGGILLVLVLFILARVFKRGAEMRDDLEGTV